jgi:hypothetical protein
MEAIFEFVLKYFIIGVMIFAVILWVANGFPTNDPADYKKWPVDKK